MCGFVLYLHDVTTAHLFVQNSVNYLLYIRWQWRNFFISAVFGYFVEQALQNVCCSDVSRRHFLNKIAIVRTFS